MGTIADTQGTLAAGGGKHAPELIPKMRTAQDERGTATKKLAHLKREQTRLSILRQSRKRTETSAADLPKRNHTQGETMDRRTTEKDFTTPHQVTMDVATPKSACHAAWQMPVVATTRTSLHQVVHDGPGEQGFAVAAENPTNLVIPRRLIKRSTLLR
jgi:hypothetical protein